MVLVGTATAGDHGPFLPRCLQVTEHLLVLRCVRGRSHLGVLVVGVSEPDPVGTLDDETDQFVVDALVHDEA